MINGNPSKHIQLKTYGATTNITNRLSAGDHEVSVMRAPSLLKPERRYSGKRVIILSDPEILQGRTPKEQFFERIWLILQFFGLLLVEICVIFILSYVIYICSQDRFKDTALHAFLTTVGFVFCLTQGSIIFFKQSVITCKLHRHTKRAIHFGIQVIGGVIGIPGVIIQMQQKNYQYSNPHVLFGLTALIAYIYSTISGTIYYIDTHCNRITRSSPKKLGHLVGSTIAIVTIYCTLLVAYKTAYFTYRVNTEMMIPLKVVTVMALVLLILIPIKSIYNTITRYSR